MRMIDHRAVRADQFQEWMIGRKWPHTQPRGSDNRSQRQADYEPVLDQDSAHDILSVDRLPRR